MHSLGKKMHWYAAWEKTSPSFLMNKTRQFDFSSPKHHQLLLTLVALLVKLFTIISWTISLKSEKSLRFYDSEGHICPNYKFMIVGRYISTFPVGP